MPLMGRSVCSNRPSRLIVAGILVLAVSAEAQRSTRAADPMAGYDQYVTDAMKQWKVPGLAIAVVRGDSMVFAKGYGVRTVGDPAPVDPETMFAIGSASKAFTGALVEMLVDDGRIALDGRVSDYLPWFELYDPYTTREATVRDLFLHRTGVVGGNSLWYGTSLSREDIVRAMRRLPPTVGFRSQFHYQNLMYIAAGEVIGQVAGQSWDELIKARLFAPLGMTRSNTSVRDLAGRPNVATPHAEFGGVVTPIPYRNIDNAGPAGSINSTVVDVAKWLRLWLGGGTFAGKRLLSEEMVREAIRPQFTVDDPDMIARLGSPNFLGYGLGWFVQDFRGRRLVNHGGNIDGMAAMVTFIPEEKLGVVILTNMNQSDVTIPLIANLYDRLLGVTPPKDYNAEYRAAWEDYERRHARPSPVRVEGTQPSLPLASYVGVYRDNFLGTATVSLAEGGKLVVHYDASPTAIGELTHWHFDSFVATMKDPMLGKIPVTFQLGADGRVAGMLFMGESKPWVKQ